MIYLGNLWSEFNASHRKFYVAKIEKAIYKLKKEGLAISLMAANFLEKNIEDIVSSDIRSIRRVLDIYERKYSSERLRSKIAEKISKHISYDNFSRKVAGKKNLCYEMSLKISNDFKIKCCPFCQINSILSKGEGVDYQYRSDLDHFFCKSKYPFLSISIWNLIPICKECNTTFKSDNNFFLNKHHNPIFDREELKFDFEKSILSGVDMDNSIIDIGIYSKSDSIKNSAKTFDLIYRYQKLANSILLDKLNSYSIYRGCLDSGKYDDLNIDRLKLFVFKSSRKEYKKNQFGKLKLDFEDYLVKIHG